MNIFLLSFPERDREKIMHNRNLDKNSKDLI